jgi:phosphoribosylanthranilate isomerase
MFVKICGLRTRDDVDTAVDAGADAVGFVLTASARQVEPRTAKALAASVPTGVLTVAVIQDVPVDQIAALASEAGVDAVQLHGAYEPSDFATLRASPVQLIRAASATGDQSLQCGANGEDMLVVDSPTSGSGEAWDWRAGPVRAPGGRWMLAGGLNPDNVAEAISRLHPWGVDVSSGVERVRGVKDAALIRAFVGAVRVIPTGCR